MREGRREGGREGVRGREIERFGVGRVRCRTYLHLFASLREHVVHARRSVTWDCWQYGVMWNQHTVREIGERADDVHAEVLRLFQAAGRTLPARSAIR